MEPLEPIVIAKVALFQVVALVYGGLACAVGTKIFRSSPLARDGSDPLSWSVYWWPHEYCELGWLLFLLILAWTAVVSYLSAAKNSDRVKPDVLWGSGVLMAFALSIVPTIWAAQVALCTVG